MIDLNLQRKTLSVELMGQEYMIIKGDFYCEYELVKDARTIEALKYELKQSVDYILQEMEK